MIGNQKLPKLKTDNIFVSSFSFSFNWEILKYQTLKCVFEEKIKSYLVLTSWYRDEKIENSDTLSVKTNYSTE